MLAFNLSPWPNQRIKKKKRLFSTVFIVSVFFSFIFPMKDYQCRLGLGPTSPVGPRPNPHFKVLSALTLQAETLKSNIKVISQIAAHQKKDGEALLKIFQCIATEKCRSGLGPTNPIQSKSTMSLQHLEMNGASYILEGETSNEHQVFSLMQGLSVLALKEIQLHEMRLLDSGLFFFKLHVIAND